MRFEALVHDLLEAVDPATRSSLLEEFAHVVVQRALAGDARMVRDLLARLWPTPRRHEVRAQLDAQNVCVSCGHHRAKPDLSILSNEELRRLRAIVKRMRESRGELIEE
jgi:hypothetical protein